MGPTGGYLPAVNAGVGFVAAAFVTGWLAERGWDRRILTTVGCSLSALAMSVGNAAIYAWGISWLPAFVGKRGDAT